MHKTPWSLLVCLAFLTSGCSDDEEAGESCESAEDCYEDVVDQSKLSGAVVCLDRVEDGYCTHDCQVDEDCCAVEGECDGDRPQVCAPFESTGVRRCFLSCEAQVVGDQDENDYCEEFAHREFGCRSTGGGSENRKVCIP